VNRRKNRAKFGPTDRIAAFAEATEAYAEGLEDPDLANIYWGKALGLRQALAILTAEDGTATARPLRSPGAICSAPRAAPVSPSVGRERKRQATAAAHQPMKGRRT
jgi:hypothetical protein